MMAQKAFIRLLVLFLGLSYVVSSVAIPTTRSIKSNKLDPSAEDLLAQDAVEFKGGKELFGMGDGFIEGRMDLETADYRGAGANRDHEPKTPGRA